MIESKVISHRGAGRALALAATIVSFSLVDAGAAHAGARAITLKGSDTMVILGQRWAETYMAAHPKTTIQVTGGGSGVGIAALINGTTDICAASRPMKDDEKQQITQKYGQAPVEVLVARDGLAIYLHESNSVDALSIPQLKQIYKVK